MDQKKYNEHAPRPARLVVARTSPGRRKLSEATQKEATSDDFPTVVRPVKVDESACKVSRVRPGRLPGLPLGARGAGRVRERRGEV